MDIHAAGVSIGGNFRSSIGQVWTLNSLVELIMSVGAVVAGVILVFLIVGGGLKVIQGAGSGDSKSAAQGQQAITWALIGFLVVIFAYWGIRLLETIVGVSFTTNPLSP